MKLVNKTSTITVAVVAALVALAVAAHGGRALTLSPSHAAVHGTGQGTAPRSGSPAGGPGNGQGSGSFPHTLTTIVTSIPSPTGTIGDPGVPCLQGFVWRKANSGDYVCVTPAVRAQAAYDNSQANNRVALFSLWLSDWTPPSQSRQNCSGDVCTTAGDYPGFPGAALYADTDRRLLERPRHHRQRLRDR